MRRIGKSRNELLETIDRPALDALPNAAYCYAECQSAPFVDGCMGEPQAACISIFKPST